jgi:NADPH:quinone reductase-like Zn-dependent oxidoreductase
MVIASFRNLLNQWFPPKPTFTEDEVPSQHGKVFIVTGGNGAVGYELIKILYGTGATIYMASRSKVFESRHLSSTADILSRKKQKRQSKP